jgi:hypothetical protein
MEFTKESLELLQSTARKAAGAVSLDLPLAGRIAIVCVDGRLETVPLPPATRGHIVYSLDDLAGWAIKAAIDYQRKDQQTAGGPPIIYHNKYGCTLVLDDADRRDRVSFPLAFSDPWILVERLAKEKVAWSQREAIQALRLTLAAEPTVVAALRRIDFTSRSAADSLIYRGRESLGKSVETELANAAEIPETIMLSVPIYRNVGEDRHYDLSCALELDLVNSRIQVVPEVGRTDEILHLHQADIAHRLEEVFTEEGLEEHPALYYGSP